MIVGAGALSILFVQMQAGFGNGALPTMGSPFPMGAQRGMDVMPQAYGGMQVRLLGV